MKRLTVLAASLLAVACAHAPMATSQPATVSAERLMADVKKGIRNADVIERSTERIPLYQKLDSIKIDTCNKSVQDVVEEIINL